MKIKIQIIIFLLIICCCILVLAKPSETKYVSWLENKHGITCDNDNFRNNCNKIAGNDIESIEWKSRHVKELMIFSISSENYRDVNGEKINIKAFGILNTYFKI